MAKEIPILDYLPDLHDRAIAIAHDDFPNLKRMTPEEIFELVFGLRMNLAELELKNDALRKAYANQARLVSEGREAPEGERFVMKSCGRVSGVNERHLRIVILFLMGFIFLVDTIVPLGYGIWEFYIVPLFLTSRLSRGRAVYVTALFITAATLADISIGPSAVPIPLAVFNKSMSIIALWIIAILLERYRYTQQVQQLAEELEEQVWRRTVDLEKTVTNLQSEISLRETIEHELLKYRERLEYLVEERTAELSREVEERKRIEIELRESEEKFRIALKNAPVVIVMQDRNRCHTWLYDPQSRLKAEDVYGKKDEDLFPPEEAARLIEIKERVMATGVGERMEMSLTPCRLNTFFFDITIEPMRDNRGAVNGVVSVSFNISERKRMEEELQDAKAHLEATLDALPDLMFEMDKNGRMINYHVQLPDKLYVPPEKFLGRTIREVLPSSAADIIMKSLDEAKRNGLSRGAIYDMNVPEGMGWFELSIASTGDSQRSDTRYIALVRDITNRKRVEDELRQSEIRFRAAVENFPGMFKVYDPRRHIQYINTIGAKMTGHTPESIIGKCDEEYLPPEISATFLPVLLRAIYTKMPQTMENHLILPSGDRWFIANFIPLLDDSRRIWQILGTAIDITDRKKAEDRIREYTERLQRQTVQLEETNKELESFSYSISHDLRAPLRTLDGFSTALLEDYADRLDPEGQSFLNRIRAAAQRMGRLIDDLLLLSRSTRAEVHVTTVNLSDQAQSVVDELRQAEPYRNVETFIQDGNITKGDETLLRQVLQNLLGNAWKFTSKTPNARIEFGVKRENGRRIFYVRDNGAGFDMQHAENLFLPFRRLHAEDEFPGTGIGLSIVKRIIERHGGAIWAESEPGKGATFYFTLNG